MKVRGAVIVKPLITISLLVAAGFAAGPTCAQSVLPASPSSSDSVALVSVNALPDAPVPPAAAGASLIVSLSTSTPIPPYLQPTDRQKFDDYGWNAVGPIAFAGAAFAGGIDQGFNFQKKWGQGWNAYGVRVVSNLGISVVTATAQYSLAEAFREDTKYYRCTCTGFVRRFAHAAIYSAFSRRGPDGHIAFSPALTISPFVGPMVAANTWLPTHNGWHLGLTMGEHNLLGQFAQNEGLEFVHGGPHTALGRLQQHFKTLSRNIPD